MALALAKPFTLLVQQGIHKDYWYKTAPEKVHLKFTEDTFDQKADEIVETIFERYEELVIDFLGQSESLPILTEVLVDRDSED